MLAQGLLLYAKILAADLMYASAIQKQGKKAENERKFNVWEPTTLSHSLSGPEKGFSKIEVQFVAA